MFCKNCGNALDDNARFCSGCGARIDDAPAPLAGKTAMVRPPEKLPERPPGTAGGRNNFSQKKNIATKKEAPKKQSFLRSRMGTIIIGILTVAVGNMLWGMINGSSTSPQEPVKSQSVQTQNTAKTTPQTTAKQAETKNYDTKDRPSVQDFSWAADAFRNGAPQGAKFIREFDDIRGTWKCMITYDPDRQKGVYARDLSNVTISGYEKTVNLVIDWYQYLPEGQAPSDMTKDADTTLRGEFFRNPSGKGTLEVNGNPYPYFTSSNFYVYQGKQYMVGNIMCKNGVAGFIAMVRP